MLTAIRRLAGERFEGVLVEEFIGTFLRLTASEQLIDSILQVSMDEGEELEIGFFTEQRIVDITLSNGKVYCYDYPLREVSEIELLELESKWVLTIKGEKKFDYNVVKPGSIDDLKKYEGSLRQHFLNP